MKDIVRDMLEPRFNKEKRETDPAFLYYDFQGWPVKKKTLRELLLELGAKETESGIIGFDKDSSILELYPETLEEDGMGYGGGSEMFFSGAEIVTSKEGNISNIYFWRDKVWKK